jgi:rubrerythrin
MSSEHSHEPELSLPLEEKLKKLLDHWVRHNRDHAGTYRDWGQKAKEQGLEAIARRLDRAAEMTLEINREFEAAAGETADRS